MEPVFLLPWVAHRLAWMLSALRQAMQSMQWPCEHFNAGQILLSVKPGQQFHQGACPGSPGVQQALAARPCSRALGASAHPAEGAGAPEARVHAPSKTAQLRCRKPPATLASPGRGRRLGVPAGDAGAPEARAPGPGRGRRQCGHRRAGAPAGRGGRRRAARRHGLRLHLHDAGGAPVQHLKTQP